MIVRSRIARSWLKAAAWSLFVWTVLGCVISAQFVFLVGMSVSDALSIVARELVPFMVISPLLFRLVATIPLERSRWRLALSVHFVAAVLIFAFSAGWSQLLPLPASLVNETPPLLNLQDPGALSLQRRLFAALFPHLPIYLVVLSVAHWFCFYRRSKAREASLNQARLEALRMQLQPHFLFNALNAIAELVHRDPEAADRMLVALSGLLRLSLETSEELLPLSRELALVENYLAIEQARFGESLKITVDAPSETRAALVPAFLLQPLVENAVRHGLEPRGVGNLSVRALINGSILKLMVADDGVGLRAGQPLSEGIGLTNTRARLRAHYDGAAKLVLRAETGLTVELTLPYRCLNEGDHR